MKGQTETDRKNMHGDAKTWRKNRRKKKKEEGDEHFDGELCQDCFSH